MPEEKPPLVSNYPLVKLPTFVVTDQRILPKEEKWSYASVPGFEFLVQSPDSEIEEYLSKFLDFHRAVSTIWPVRDLKDDVPAVVVICSSAVRYEEFSPGAQRSGRSSGRSSATARHEIATSVINLSVAQSDSDAPLAAERLLQRFYANAILARVGTHTAPWLRSGLGKMLRGMEVRGSSFGFPGLHSDPTLTLRERGSPADLQVALGKGDFLPLERLFTLATNPPEVASPADGKIRFVNGVRASSLLDAEPSGVWTDECYEFAHFCLFGSRGKYRVPYLRLGLMAGDRPIDENRFRALFGMDFHQMELKLWRYTAVGRAEAFISSGKSASLHFRDATDGEVGRIRGEVLLNGGNLEAAHTSLIASYLRGSRDPQLLAVLGLAEFAENKTERARRFLEVAVAEHTSRAKAYLELAQLREADEISHAAGPNEKLSDAQVALVLAPLEQGAELPPAFAETYETLADVLRHASRPPSPAEFGQLEQGARRFPQDRLLKFQGNR